MPKLNNLARLLLRWLQGNSPSFRKGSEVKLVIATVAASLAFVGAAQAVTTVTVEAAGATTTSLTNGQIAVETFDTQSNGTNIITVNTSFAAIGVTGVFTDAQVLVADQYGGAGGIGNQAAVRGGNPLEISFTGTPLNYFGVWASALDAANTVSFYQGATLLSSTNLTAFPLPGTYSGNPGGTFVGQNASEKYGFFSFRVSEGYDRVILSQNGGGGFELDNVTIGAVPEPASWVMLIAGFGLVGAAARRRRTAVVAA
jgi:hypothetical protein